MAGSPTPSKFDSQDVTVGELLTAHLTTALSQVTTEQELREREAELEAQNERLEQFASMVSHDLRNPLSVASGNLELYRETGEESRLETIDTALTRIQELITDLTSSWHRELVSLWHPRRNHGTAPLGWDGSGVGGYWLANQPLLLSRHGIRDFR